jgi:dihydropteroate synthase
MAPLLMGILNITPDSFSDGGLYEGVSQAVEHAAYLVDSGAAIVDVGAESSRPGARLISLEDEWSRLAPVLEALQPLRESARISVDTQKPEIMRRAVALGIDMINDIGGHASPVDLKEFAKNPRIQYVAMHMHGNPQTMQAAPLKAANVCQVVSDFFRLSRQKALNAGFDASRIWVDPGIGFGKTDAANVALLGAIAGWSTEYQVAVGVSRKSLMGRVLGIPAPEDRDPPSKMLELGVALLGAKLIRTHDVASLRRLTHLMQGES